MFWRRVDDAVRFEADDGGRVGIAKDFTPMLVARFRALRGDVRPGRAAPARWARAWSEYDDAERRSRRFHAERGNEMCTWSFSFNSRGSSFAGSGWRRPFWTFALARWARPWLESDDAERR
jgi:hypothetical protein